MNQEKSSSSTSNELPAPIDQHLPESYNETNRSKQVESGMSVGAYPVSPAVTTAFNSVNTQQFSSTASVATSSVNTPQIADDVSLIEKDWVESSKRIIAKTAGDPHAQSDELGVVKKDYKKKRFNIDSDLGKAA